MLTTITIICIIGQLGVLASLATIDYDLRKLDKELDSALSGNWGDES